MGNTECFVFEVTREWLLEHATEKRAWTRDQVEALGVSWPLQRGWHAEVIGLLITADQKAQFEQRLTAVEAGTAGKTEIKRHGRQNRRRRAI